MKTYIITPLFCKATLFFDQLQHMEANQLLSKDMVHVVVNDRYPIDRIHNDQLLFNFARQFGCRYEECLINVGMQKAINFALQIIEPNDNDIIILSDADDRASPGSYQAIRDVIKSDESIAVAALTFKSIRENLAKLNLPVEVVKAHDRWVSCLRHPTVDMWRIAAYSMKWIRQIGGFGQTNTYWGGLEAYLYGKWRVQGKHLAYLMDYHCEHAPIPPDSIDPKYIEFKNEVNRRNGAGSFGEKESFEEWLNRLECP